MTRLTVLLTALALLLLPLPAAAGGSTSVLLVAPRLEQTASLYRTDKRYEQLQALVHSNQTSQKVNSPSEINAHAQGPVVVASWLAHDTAVWRVDRIYLKAPGGPWIATSLHGIVDPALNEKLVWHKSPNPSELVQVLAQLRLLDRTAQQTTPAPSPKEPAAAPATDRAEVETAGATTGLWWSLAGVLVGVLLTVVALRLVRRRALSPRIEPIG